MDSLCRSTFFYATFHRWFARDRSETEHGVCSITWAVNVFPRAWSVRRWVWSLLWLDDSFATDIIIGSPFLCLLVLSVPLHIISHAGREKAGEKRREEKKKRVLIAIRSSHRAQSQSTNQIKGNYRQAKIERTRDTNIHDEHIQRSTRRRSRKCVVTKSIHRFLFPVW